MPGAALRLIASCALWAVGIAPAAASAAVSATTAAAQDSAQSPQNPNLAKLRAFQDRDARLQNIGWRLVHGNAAFCDTIIPSIGLQLQDMAMFAKPDLVRAALGLEGSFAVQTVAKGSPAGEAGPFALNREIAGLDETDPNIWKAGEALYWQRLTRAHDWIEERLASQGAVTIRFADGSTSKLSPVPVCATRFEILGRTKRAMAEGSRVIIGQRFPGFEWEEDDDFAGVVAHELAHNFLRHRLWLDRNGRKRSHIRLTEREADRLMPWLLANAGYDPKAAYRFMVRWGKSHDGGLFRTRTHDGWDERAEFIAAELPIVTDLMAREGKADWSVHFRREIDADQGVVPKDNVAQRE